MQPWFPAASLGFRSAECEAYYNRMPWSTDIYSATHVDTGIHYAINAQPNCMCHDVDANHKNKGKYLCIRGPVEELHLGPPLVVQAYGVLPGKHNLDAVFLLQLFAQGFHENVFNVLNLHGDVHVVSTTSST